MADPAVIADMRGEFSDHFLRSHKIRVNVILSAPYYCIFSNRRKSYKRSGQNIQ